MTATVLQVITKPVIMRKYIIKQDRTSVEKLAVNTNRLYGLIYSFYKPRDLLRVNS